MAGGSVREERTAHDHEDALAVVRALAPRLPTDGAGPAEAVTSWLRSMCSAAAGALGADGVGVSLMTDAGVLGVAAAADRVTEALGVLQFTLGEGPCVEAFESQRPVLMSSLDTAAGRWPAFAPAASALGVAAVFAFPLQVGAARLGALDLHRGRPGALEPAAVALALAFAEVTVEVLVDAQGGVPSGADPGGLDDILSAQYVVYQAQGMTMVDLEVPLVEALARLRAYAFAQDRPLDDIARDIVAGRLRLDGDTA